MTRWFRWYRGTSENPKFRLAARKGGVPLIVIMAVWQVLLEDAAHEDHRGICEKKEDFIAAALDIDDDGTVEGALRGLEYAGLISVDSGSIAILDWSKWQYEQDAADPTNAERQRRYKERKRLESANEATANEAVTVGNGTVTVETRPDTDTDTDIKPSVLERADKPAPKPRKPSSDDRVFDILTNALTEANARAVIEHRRAKGARLTERAAELLVAEFFKAHSPDDAAETMIAQGWQGFNVEWYRRAKPAAKIIEATGAH